MHKLFRVFIFLNLLFIPLVAILTGACSIHYGKLNNRAKKQLREVLVLNEGEYAFRDLNKNVMPDVYEDSRQKIDLRITDLLSQMMIEEKAGMMWHPPICVGKKGYLFGKLNIAAKSMNSAWELVLNNKINHFNGLVCTDWGIVDGFRFMGIGIVGAKAWCVEKQKENLPYDSENPLFKFGFGQRYD